MNRHRTGLARLAFSLGAVCTTAALVTAAAFTDSSDVEVILDGERNRFDLVVAGSGEAGWTPSAEDWQQGRPDAVRIPVGAAGELLAPGGVVRYRIAVRNDSPTIAGLVDLEVTDPDDRRGRVDPGTGRFVELFDQLRIVVRHGSDVLIDRAPGTEPMRAGWDLPLEPDEHRVLDVELSLPVEVDDRWQGSTTDLAFTVHGVGA